jgi:RNA polymerase sigma factor (TIGR02999 family)
VNDVTHILAAMEHGDAHAARELLPAVYEELRRLARKQLQHEKPGQTLQATALVHEAYLRLAGAGGTNWTGRTHFYRAAAEAMRHILVDNARHKKAQCHGGELHRVDIPLELTAVVSESIQEEEQLALHEALDRLAAEDPQKAELVKLRYFTGLSLDEIAGLLGISRASANRHWTYALAWLGDAIRNHAA